MLEGKKEESQNPKLIEGHESNVEGKLFGERNGKY